MRLVVASLTGALFYVSVKSLSIGPLPCTTPEVSATFNIRALTSLPFPSKHFLQFLYLFAPIIDSLFTL